MSKGLLVLVIILGIIGLVIGTVSIVVLVGRVKRFKRALSVWARIGGINCLNQPTAPICQEIVNTPVSFPDYNRPILSIFDTSAALFAANICQRVIVYVGSSDPKTLQLPGFSGYELVSDDNDKSPQAVVWCNNEQCAISFHGTISIEELHTDVDYEEVSVDDYRLHEGFYKQYLRINNKLATLIPSTVRQVFIAGHSLGAALAFLTAHDLVNRGNLAVEVWGSAPPRVGDQIFADKLSSRARCNSLINLADVIPSLPWSYMPNFSYPDRVNAFSHVGSLNVFNNLKHDLLSCHLLPAYYEAIKTGMVVKLP